MKRKPKSYRFGFIGLGRMAEAMLRGLLSSGLASPGEILASRTSAAALRKLAQRHKIAVTADNREVARRCQMVWIGVKPYQAGAVLNEIRSSLNPRATILSMMTGVSTQFLRRRLGPRPHLIRLMPNTPCLLGAGMTGIFFPRGTPPKIKKMVSNIMNSLGRSLVVLAETDLDAVTGLSGSGVAFLYALAEGLINGGKKSGLSIPAATILAYQTFLGASRMLLESGKPPRALIDQVVTKRGTTEAGLKVLKRKAAENILAEAVVKATARAREIRKDNDRCTP